MVNCGELYTICTKKDRLCLSFYFLYNDPLQFLCIRLIPVVGVEPTLQKEHDFESCASANSATPAKYGGGNRIRTGDKGFADLCLTTWLCRHLTQLQGFEPLHDKIKILFCPLAMAQKIF